MSKNPFADYEAKVIRADLRIRQARNRYQKLQRKADFAKQSLDNEISFRKNIDIEWDEDNG